MIETKFKHTDIGLVPEEWEVKTLGQIGSFTKGSGISRAESQTGTIPAIRYGEIYTDHNDYIREFKSYITPQIALNARKIHKGDILFTASGETKEDIGKSVAFIDDFEAYAGGDLIILSPSEDCNPVYMGYITNSKSSQLQKSSKGQGDAVVHIVTDEIKSIEIPFPPLSEQRRIASALMKVDALISNLDKLIAKKQAIKQGAMQELLTGKKRLPGFKGEWKEIRLGDVAKMNSGGTPDSKNAAYYSGTIPFLSISDMSNCGKFITHTQKHITSEAVANSSARIYPKGTLLYAMYASLGKTSIAQIDMAISQAILGIITDETILDKEYLYYNLCYIESKVIQMGQTGTQSNLSKALVEEFIFTIPEVDEQKAIANVFICVDSEISVLEKKRDKYRQIKQGMMRDLLTGRIRLVEDDHMERKCYSIGLQNQSFDGAVAAEPSPQ